MSDYPMKIEVVVCNQDELKAVYGVLASVAQSSDDRVWFPQETQSVSDTKPEPAATEPEKKTRKPREAKAPVEQAEPETSGEVDLGDEKPAAVPVKDYTDSELSQVANAAVQKLGSPDAVRKIIAQYTPAGDTPHTRNIPAADRHAFVTFIEGLDAKATASTDDF